MIDFTTNVKRYFWKGIDKPAIGEYIRELERMKKELSEMRFNARHVFAIDEDRLKALNATIDQELTYARFYLSYFKRAKEPDFNTWQFAENVEDRWNGGTHSEWTRSNGKVKVIIKIKDNKSSMRISLHVKNDNGHLKFLEHEFSEHELKYSNLRKKESVEKQIQEYQAEAAKVFRDHEYPRYCHENMQYLQLQTLLHVGSWEAAQ